ncbi:phosphoglucosamine mutase [Chloroflexota bacterium]
MQKTLEEYYKSGKHLFGTSGIRGVAEAELSSEFCWEIARAIGTSLKPGSKVCIATDTRLSREMVKGAVISGLRLSGIDVTDLGILPTPALAFLTRDMDFDTGVMITASHNPPEYNGIKLFNGDSLGYSPRQETKIEKVYRDKRFRALNVGSLSEDDRAGRRYFQSMIDKFPHFDHCPRIVVDAGNGAASGFASELFSVMGMEVIPLNDKPDGYFPGRNPEPKEDTLEGTIEYLRQKDADLAICFDGDADRVVFCDKEGFLGLDEMIAFISRLAVIESGKRRVATTVETGKLIELALEDLGSEVVRSRVGDVSVAYLAQKLDAAVGVEPVGVYIMPEIGYYPDSMYATLILLSRINNTGEIREFLNSLPQLNRSSRKVACPNHLKMLVMGMLKKQAVLFQPSELNTLDGLRFEYDDSWMLIRASGTEPVIRITAESKSKEEAESLLSKGEKAVVDVLGELA